VTPTTVSTSLVPPGPAYSLETGWTERGGAFEPTHAWLFGHPTYWSRKGITPIIGLDWGNPWGSGRELAKMAFWQFVADRVEWYDVKAFARDLEQRQKRAERERAERDAGHIDLFGD